MALDSRIALGLIAFVLIYALADAFRTVLKGSKT